MEGVKSMTEMRRVTVAMPDEIDKRILELRKDDRFTRCSYSEIVRKVLERGIDLMFPEPDGKGA